MKIFLSFDNILSQPLKDDSVSYMAKIKNQETLAKVLLNTYSPSPHRGLRDGVLMFIGWLCRLVLCKVGIV